MRTLLVVFTLLAAPSLHAQGIGVELTPFAGFRTGGTITSAATDFFGDAVKVNNSGTYGLLLDVPLSRDFQLELMANRQDSRLVRRGGLFEPENRIADVALTYYQVGGLWDLGGRNLRPFISLGIGGTTIKPDIPGVAAENRFSGNLGAGAKFFATSDCGSRLGVTGRASTTVTETASAATTMEVTFIRWKGTWD
ncbi:MAG: hypothetical protein ABI718_10745 [Acidobacteriota bacterium]